MLVTAGYFNYTANTEENSIETTSEISSKTNNINTEIDENAEKTERTEFENTGIENNENTEIARQENINGNNNDNSNNNNDNNNREEEKIGDARLVNSNEIEEDYFSETKLERDTNYADMISTYTKILEDNSIAEPQKSIAMKEITEITNTKNAISVCENILSTKDFKDYVVLVNKESVNVVVKKEGELTKDKVAQIQNIISRELNSKIENIHITEKD